MQMTWVDLTYPDDLEADLEQLNHVLAGSSEGYLMDKRFIRKNGEVIHASISVRCVRRADGSINYFVALVQDITDRKRAEKEREQLISEQAARVEAEEQGRKSAFLAEVSTQLASSLNYETTLARVAKLTVPFLADWCAVDILDEDQVIRRVALAHCDSSKVELAWELNRRYPETINGDVGLPTVWRTGRSAIASEITDSHLVAAAQDAEHLGILRELGFKSAIVVPLLTRGRTFGAMTFVTAESERRYKTADLSLVEDLARRAALAVDNALLYREAQAARRIAEQTAERNATLQAVTAAFSEALTPAQVGEVVVNQGLAALKAAAGFVALLTDNDKTLGLVSTFGYPQEILNTWSRFPLAASLPITDAVRTQQPILIESRKVWAELYPHVAIEYASSNTNAWVAIPLIVEGHSVGGLGLSFVEPQTFSQEDCAFMLALAQQCAQAIERARAYAAERQARADAEAANRTKDEFLATLSHELRTPLNSMLGWTQLLRTRKFDEAKIVRALETIDRNTKSLAALIEDILDVSRIITGKLHICAHVCQLVSVIEGAIESVRPAAEAKTIQMECFLDTSTGPVWGDTNRWQEVVWNLLSNAIKFTPKGGRVEVRLERVDSLVNSKELNVEGLKVEGSNQPSNLQPSNLQPSTSYVQIQVIDKGQGISPDFLPHVFERFRQENNSSTRSYSGLGLGLAIVRYLVELHGGTVQASSLGEGLGATFTVQLPLYVSSRESKLGSRQLEVSSRDTANHSLLTEAPVSSPQSPLKGLRVLIVDDEADARELLATILDQSGAQVMAAASAGEALEFLSQSKADVLVSDIAMPKVDGYALIRQVRELQAEQGGYIPAVALTAYARESDRISALEAGFQVHLAKPYDPDELVTLVAKLAGCKAKSVSAY